MPWLVASLATLLLAAPAQAHFGQGELAAKQLVNERWDVCPFELMTHVLMGPSMAWADSANCRVWFSPSWHEHGWRWRCTWLAHEVGHLAGRSHSSDPNHLMYPAPKQYEGCVR